GEQQREMREGPYRVVDQGEVGPGRGQLAPQPDGLAVRAEVAVPGDDLVTALAERRREPRLDLQAERAHLRVNEVTAVGRGGDCDTCHGNPFRLELLRVGGPAGAPVPAARARPRAPRSGGTRRWPASR